ncbi:MULTISPECIES: hypothetical protein [Lysinibacillus]|uniref:hypothetical protein n=1 Tax=Lysinibacillus TaxID=400634 RepID=UPI0004DF5FE2|nr:hypothetical protein [Lysinibacillus sphaericus]MBG9691490.1 hypothetical protein [Lysinibacillus sphaericus]QPA59059.1 hypothetical protein INQ55_01285 [Lysinibacillus sphaericus]
MSSKTVTNASLTRNGYIKFRIFKETEPFSEINSFEEVDVPIIHINTLAQIMYEALKGYDYESLPIIPTIIILSGNTVWGISDEGIYLIDFYKEILFPIKYIEEDWNAIKKESKSTLAIGYLERKNVIKTQKFKEVVEEISLKMRQVIELHGELSDIITEKKVGLNILPISSIQWIRKKRF